jgi:23S rRNA (guanosine2251-2'-O)-methyltransferase
MAGNSKRRGATRKSGSKKGPTTGSGGQRRKGLQGRGPTPKATERTSHPAARRARRAAKTESNQRPATDVVAGRNAVFEVLQAGAPVTAVFVAVGVEMDQRVRDIVSIAGKTGLPLLETPRPELDRITGGAVHQGVAVRLPEYEYAHPDDLIGRDAADADLIVALDGVKDPRNLGAVVRSAAAFGASGVVVPTRRAAPVTAVAWKTSAGALARVPVARATNLARQLSEYQQAGLFVAGLAADGEVDLAEFELSTEPLVLVVGSEGEGMSRLVAETCDVRVRIPMADAAESLNAGVAAGIALHAIATHRAPQG